MNRIMAEKLFNLYEAANRLDVPAGWLRDLALAGQIPCIRIGKRKLRFELTSTRAAIRGLIAKQRSNTILAGGNR